MRKRWFAVLVAGILLILVAASASDAAEGSLEENEYLRIAAQAVRDQYPGVDPLSEAEYEVRGSLFRGNAYEYTFVTKNIRHGDVVVTVSADGTVTGITADLAVATGDTLFGRYWRVYGYFGEWDQKIWVQLGKDMQAMDPEETEGNLLKLTRYPEENTVRIRRGEAQRLALQATGNRMAEVNTCVLAEADPHPVWIARVIVYDGREWDPVIGIDAETGDVVFRERYETDVTPHYVLFSVPETWRIVRSAFYLARNAVVFTYADHDLDDPDTDVYDMENWEMAQDGLTVRFTGRWKGMKAYETELDLQGNVVRCEQSDSPSAVEKPEPDSGEEERWASVPTPQPDGKPWIWGNAFAPEEYWNRMAKAMDQYGVTFENLKEKLFDWSREYGWPGDGDWPQELYIIGHMLVDVRPDYLAEQEHMEYPVFENPEKKTKEEIEEIALKTFREAAEPIMGAEWAERLSMHGVLWDTGVYEYYGVDWQEPAWRVNFLELEECWEDKGFVMLDEDGNVLTVQVEPYGGG